MAKFPPTLPTCWNRNIIQELTCLSPTIGVSARLVARCLFGEVKANPDKTRSGRMLEVVQRNAVGTLLGFGTRGMVSPPALRRLLPARWVSKLASPLNK